MQLRDTASKRALFEIVFYVFIVGLILSLAVFAGFSLGGFSETFQSEIISISNYLGTFLIYIPLLIISLLLIIYPIMNHTFIRQGEHPATQEGASWLRIFTISYLFNPEDSLLWFIANRSKDKKSVKWLTNIMRVIFISVLIFLGIGILQTFNPTLNVVGIPQTTQQITATSDIIFTAGIPSIAENGTLLFIMFFLLGIDALLTSLFVKNKSLKLPIFFTVALLVIAPLMGYQWMSYHSIVYGNSEASLIATFIFGWLGATLTIVTGIAIWWLIWHFFNNLVIKLIELSSSKEDVSFILIGVWIVLFLLYLGVEFLIFKKRKKNKEQLIVS